MCPLPTRLRCLSEPQQFMTRRFHCMLYDVIVGLRPVVDALNRLGVRHMLTGPIATGIHGIGRLPLDVEIVAALSARPIARSQLWYDVQSVLKVQGDALDLDYLRTTAESAGLGAVLHTLLGQRDTVPLSWDCPLDAEARWLAHVRRLTPTERFTLDRYDMAEARVVVAGVYG